MPTPAATAPHDTPPSDGPRTDELSAMVARFFSDPSSRADPSALYGRLVREAPVIELGPMWLVSGYDELLKLSGRPELRTFPAVGNRTQPITLVPTLAASLALMLPLREGADHRRLKGLAAATFSPRRIAALHGLIEGAVDAALDELVARRELDIVDDLALPLPVAISTAMLDIPAAERTQVGTWADLVRRQLFRFDLDGAELDRVEAELQELVSYVRHLCAERRRRPGPDLITDLAQAAAAGRLSDDELVAFVLMLFVNGLETLSAGLTMAIWQVLLAPGELQRLADDPARAEAAFDEAQRLHSPVRFSARTLVGDVTLGDHRIPAGAVVALCFAAANRDPRRFSDADRFDPDRVRGRHLAFGHGTHYCLGAQLALSTGATVLRGLATRCPDLSTDVSPANARWSPSLAFTSLESLPVYLTRVTRAA